MLVFVFFKTAHFIKENLKIINYLDTDAMLVLMRVFGKENGWALFSTEKESIFPSFWGSKETGSKTRPLDKCRRLFPIFLFTMETIKAFKKMALGKFFFKIKTRLKESFKRTRSTVMALTFSTTEKNMKALGTIPKWMAKASTILKTELDLMDFTVLVTDTAKEFFIFKMENLKKAAGLWEWSRTQNQLPKE